MTTVTDPTFLTHAATVIAQQRNSSLDALAAAEAHRTIEVADLRKQIDELRKQIDELRKQIDESEPQTS
ncbi:hypothetical protein RHODGE_RHODGE_03970 [Rhodoplanes serenus]|uniref:Uncharacterized protein n=1 Tax=Rhodoplanes serenus TaxID=200615 RepID=A0A3S4B3Q4_9BRAD|nr:hypothetical protein [Rhodoplanes serenus]VCU10766.1 hypothetical protein RHODGE_RHODGE_03970 [Rhodoplanes serenus]